MPFLNISDWKINWCINSDPNQKISKNWIKIYLNADGIIDDILIRIIPAGWKILMPKKSIKWYGFIAYVEDSEWNEIWLHSSN
jgi:predicted enzyme related to lactoylglutathione lyase